MTHKALEPATLGPLKLANHIVVAPTTRRTLGNLPSGMIAEYYRQRATAGLIVTEGMSTTDGFGDPRVPGLFNHDHVAWWGYVTAAVHWRRGSIFARLVHPAEPSTAPERNRVRDAFVRSAVLAVRAGFDGVEVHTANGNALSQSLNPLVSDRRIDGHARFSLDVVDDVANAIGADRTGLRLSPCVNGVLTQDEALPDTYSYLAAELQKIGAAYLHLINRSAPAISSRALREVFTNTLILNDGSQTIDDIDAAIESGDADLISVGRPLIDSPDFIERLKRSVPLREDSEGTWLAPTPGGVARFIDHPTAA